RFGTCLGIAGPPCGWRRRRSLRGGRRLVASARTTSYAVGFPSMAVIERRGLTKQYGRQLVPALADLDLTVEPGEIFGFLGPNGAGKSTTIRLLLGFLHPTAGGATVLGMDIGAGSVEIRRRTGYLPGGIGFLGGLTGDGL